MYLKIIIALIAGAIAFFGIFGFAEWSIRYPLAYFLAYPIKISVMLVGITGLLFFAFWNSIPRSQAIENFVDKTKADQIFLDDIKSTATLFKIGDYLRTADPSGKSDVEVLQDLAQLYRLVYDTAPSKLKPLISGSPRQFPNPTQFLFIRIHEIQLGVFFLSYDNSKNDLEIETFDFEKITDIDKLQKETGGPIRADYWERCFKTLNKYKDTNGNTNDGFSPKGYGIENNNPRETGLWAFGIIPLPLSAFAYKGIIEDQLYVEGLF